jgi:hypothetical protein
MKCLTISNDRLYVEHGGAILGLNVRNSNKMFTSIELPKQTLLGWTSLGERILRLGVHSLHVNADLEMIIVVRKRVLRYDLLARRFTHSFDIFRGKRFLFLCLGAGGDLLFGEYFSNKNRQSVRIYRSSDGGRSFEIAHEFPPGTIRHVHGVFHDPFTDALWITTGDTDAESGIWVTQDNFKSLERKVGGNQQTRAVQILFTATHVYFGSDTPLEKNFIYRLHKETGAVERLQEVESSIFWGCKVGDCLFFSTAAEPSRLNTSRYVYIWGSQNGKKWKRIAGFRKDIWPMKLFQYGQIFFPSGENNTRHLWFTPFATEKHMRLQHINISDLF